MFLSMLFKFKNQILKHHMFPMQQLIRLSIQIINRVNFLLEYIIQINNLIR